MEHGEGGQASWAPEILDQTGPALARVIDADGADGTPPSVDGFRILDQIGVGGAASVWMAHDIGLDRIVAIKVLNVIPTTYTLARTDAPSRAIDQFREECRLLGAINDHPHVVSVHETGWTVSGKPFLVMAYCGGGSVKTRIRAQGGLRTEEVLSIGIGIAGALAAAHGNEPMILHRDVKPENVLFASDGVPVLADFGVAAVAVDGSAKTATITPSHVAPEVVCGHPHTISSDVYSLASTLYEMAEGRSPFFSPRQPIDELLDRIVNEPAPLPRQGGLPAEVERLLMDALSKDPEARPANMTTFARRMQVAQERLGLTPTVFWAPWDALPRREQPVAARASAATPAQRAAASPPASSSSSATASGAVGQRTETTSPKPQEPGLRADGRERDRFEPADRNPQAAPIGSAPGPTHPPAPRTTTPQRRLRSERGLRTPVPPKHEAETGTTARGPRTPSSRPRRSRVDSHAAEPFPTRPKWRMALILVAVAVAAIVIWLVITKLLGDGGTTVTGAAALLPHSVRARPGLAPWPI